MVVHLCRDYLTQNVTTGNRPWINSYVSSIFLRRILSFTYVGDTNYNINAVGQLLFATGDTTPTANTPTFPVGNKAGIANNGAAIEVSIPVSVRGVISADIGRILVLKSPLYPYRNSGLFLITALQQGNTTTVAAGSNAVSLPTATIYAASVSGFPASGSFFAGPNTTVASGSNGVALPTGTINVASTTGFPNSGSIILLSTTGSQTITYTGLNAGTQFTGCTGGAGSMFTGGTVFSSNNIQTINYTGTQNASRTIAAGSNGQVLPQGTINVASTAGFLGSGTITVTTSAGAQTVTYTSTSGGTQFTGCSGGTGTMSTGGAVTQIAFTGCSSGTGTLATGEPIYNQNKFVVDYRGNGDLALVENTDTVPWYLYDKDINCPTQGANNGGTGYRGYGTSTTPRIILQSPHSTGYQVRICNETATDSNSNFNTALITFAPGFAGNSAGDFPVGGRHLHGALYYDTSSALFNTSTGCGDNAGAGPQFRMTLIGDDTGQSFHIFARRPLNAGSPPSFYLTFGIPDNEPAPLPLDNVERLYALGNGASNNLGNGRTNDVSLFVGHYVTVSIQGAAFKWVPISCSPSSLTYLSGVVQGASPMFDGSAGDSPFTSSTELLPVDLVAGVVNTWHDITNSISYPFYPKAMGTLPFIKNGRTNFGDYTLTTDSASWSVSTTSGNGVSPIQITTTATNTLVTGQTVAISGVGGNTAANGTFVVTVINNTQFTLNGTTGNGAFTTGGTVLRGSSFQHMRRGIYIPWNGPAVVP